MKQQVRYRHNYHRQAARLVSHYSRVANGTIVPINEANVNSLRRPAGGGGSGGVGQVSYLQQTRRTTNERLTGSSSGLTITRGGGGSNPTKSDSTLKTLGEIAGVAGGVITSYQLAKGALNKYRAISEGVRNATNEMGQQIANKDILTRVAGHLNAAWNESDVGKGINQIRDDLNSGIRFARGLRQGIIDRYGARS